MDTRVYDNFTLDWTILAYASAEEQEASETPEDEEDYSAESAVVANGAAPVTHTNRVTQTLQVIINGEPVMLTGKSDYIFVDIFDYYNFDLNAGGGRGVITQLNGEDAAYVAALKNGDQITLGWKEN